MIVQGTLNKFGEWSHKINETRYANKIPLLAFKVIAISCKLSANASVGIARSTVVTRCWICAISQKRRPFRIPLRRENKKSAGAISGEYGGCSRTLTLRVARKCLTRIAVCRDGFVVEQFPMTTLEQLWPNPPNALQQPFRNSLVGFRIDTHSHTDSLNRS
ncbi:hypothetical protein AVEN_37208-1 [Araneus ventricosus]|uniref:Uncharacterized protein n=1 Tax=Araneus ventricosus TaxID=182803 RepID=A0A4Y2WKJ7_ARAVE|nr:hypothetical protein AVEN_37208-1 [Araneus ventricosus]